MHGIYASLQWLPLWTPVLSHQGEQRCVDGLQLLRQRLPLLLCQCRRPVLRALHLTVGGHDDPKNACEGAQQLHRASMCQRGPKHGMLCLHVPTLTL